MKSFIDRLRLALGLREPTPQENIQQLRDAAARIRGYSNSTADLLLKQASEEERRLGGRG
jgi:hypothetical protein